MVRFMKNRCIFYGLFVMLLAAVLTSCINDDNGDAWSLGVGDKCPDFNITMNDGREISTEQLRGRKSMIVFFNTTCGDCLCEFPVLQDLYDIVRERQDESKVEIICISRGQGRTPCASAGRITACRSRTPPRPTNRSTISSPQPLCRVFM